MPQAQVNGIKLHYETSGQGQPLLLIMGLGAPAAAWDPEFVQALGQTHKVITYDNRGTGLSDKPDEPYSIALFASEAVSLLDALNIPRAHILGVSMGGMIAQELSR
jgi:pimeloyl-ACP methyl ester carboxylesterase